MDKLQTLIDILIQYLNKQIQPISFFGFIFKYVTPFFVLGSAIVAIYVYRKGKNREIYEKVLKEVYAPLYDYFIKQELFCDLYKIERDIKETPILELKNKSQTQKITFGKNQGIQNNIEVTNVMGLSRESFLELQNNVNIGLANKELHTLLTMYEVTCYIENIKKHLMTLIVEQQFLK